MRSEQSWSLLDPKPVLLYLPKCDDYIVYWNGIAMSHSMALCMAMEHLGIYATPEMKNEIETSYRKIYHANGFDTRAWDGVVEHQPVYGYLRSIMRDHLGKVLADKEPQEVLKWFDYNRARELAE